MLERLDSTDRAVFAMAGHACRTAVVDSDLPRAGTGMGMPLNVMLRWAREHGCSWSAFTYAMAAKCGYLEVWRWARKRNCPWDARARRLAEVGGNLEVLQLLDEQGAPWDDLVLG